MTETEKEIYNAGYTKGFIKALSSHSDFCGMSEKEIIKLMINVLEGDENEPKAIKQTFLSVNGDHFSCPNCNSNLFILMNNGKYKCNNCDTWFEGK